MANQENRSPLFSRHQPGGVFSVVDETMHGQNIWFVDSTKTATGGDTVGHGRSPDSPFLTLDYAFASGEMVAGDEVFLGEGHNEGGNAVLFDMDLANIRVVGLGRGTDRARFDFDNAASVVTIGANGCTLENIDFLPSAASVLIGVQVETGVTNFTLKNCRFLEAETAGDEFVETVQLTSGNHDCRINGNLFRTEVAAGAATECINVAAASNRLFIEDNKFVGNWSVGAIVDVAAGVGYQIHRNKMKIADGVPGIALQAATTGQIGDNYIESTGLAADGMIVAAGCAWFNNYGCTADGTTAELIGIGAEELPPDSAQGAGLNIYVDSEHGGAANTGTAWNDALDTIDAAVALCTDDHGDIIHCAPFHNEVVGGAAAIDLDVRGITLKGYGLGWMAPTLNFTTNTDTVEVNAAGVVIDGIHFIGDVADLAVMLDITGNADGSTVKNCEFMDLAAGAEVLVCIGLAVNADRVDIHHNRFLTTTGGDATDAILMAGATDRVRIHDNLFIGDWSSGCIDGSAGAGTDILIQNNTMNNVDAVAGFCVNLNAATTGVVDNNTCHSGVTGVDPIQAAACLRSRNVVTQHEGVQAIADLGIEVVRGTGVVPQTNTLALFTVAGGDVEISAIIGQVDTNNFGAVANATYLAATPTTGQLSALCATLDLTGTTIGTHLSISGNPTDTLQKHGMVMATKIVAQIGTINMTCAGSEANGAQVQWTLWYRPITAGATVVAA